LIVGLKGVVETLQTDSFYINVNGVIYEVFSTAIDLDQIKLGDQLNIHIAQIIREDSSNLYGFLKNDTKVFFKELIKITGVGAKVAMGILSTISEVELIDIIERGDEKALIKVPKIGLKTAKRILNELVEIKDRFKIQNLTSSQTSEKSIAIQTLKQLGFNNNLVIQSVTNSTMKTHQEIIKDCLSQFVK